MSYIILLIFALRYLTEQNPVFLNTPNYRVPSKMTGGISESKLFVKVTSQLDKLAHIGILEIGGLK